MRSVSVRLADLQTVKLPLGFVGENEHTQVLFDCKKAFDQYPAAVPTLTVVPPRGESYPAVVSREGDIVTWLVSASDLIAEGQGEIQLAFVQDETVMKTWTGKTRIERSIIPTGSVPTPIENWIEQAGEKLGEVDEAVQDALEAAEAANDAAEHMPYIGDDGYWYSWNGTTWVKGVKAEGVDGDPGQPGADGVTYTPTVTSEGEISWSNDGGKPNPAPVNIKGPKGDPGKDADPEKLIDDTTTTETDKVWSAKKTYDEVSETKSALLSKQDAPASGAEAGKLLGLALVDGQLVPVWSGIPVSDVQINGTSILSQGVANVPIAGTSALGVVKVNGNGLTMDNTGLLKMYPAGSNAVKAGTSESYPVSPKYQHESVFYALSKLAGVDLASETVTLGQFPNNSLIAIQKMLGIYEAPWELIREDTFTNAESADHIITVDGDGDAFELTDCVLQFETPVQQTDSAKGYYGIVLFYYNDNDCFTTESSAWSQDANGYAHGLMCVVENRNGMIFAGATYQTTGGNATQFRYRYVIGFNESCGIANKTKTTTIKKINIKLVKGTGHYKLYGRRKWWT